MYVEPFINNRDRVKSSFAGPCKAGEEIYVIVHRAKYFCWAYRSKAFANEMANHMAQRVAFEDFSNTGNWKDDPKFVVLSDRTHR